MYIYIYIYIYMMFNLISGSTAVITIPGPDHRVHAQAQG